MVPETFVLLVLDLAVVEHSLRVLFDLLVLLELGLECVMLKGVFRWPMLGVIWFVRWVRFDKLPDLFLELSLLLVDAQSLVYLACLTDLACSVRVRWIVVDSAFWGGGLIIVYQVHFIFLEYWQFEHFILEIILLVDIVVIHFGKWVTLFLKTGLIFAKGTRLAPTNQLWVLHFKHLILLLQVIDLFLS